MQDLKLNFQLRVLIQYNEEVEAEMKRLMAGKRVGKSGDSERSIHHTAQERGSGAHSQLIFKGALRYVDMGVGRGHPLGGLKATRISLQSSHREGITQIKDRTFKPKKIYAKAIFGRLTTLQNRLLYGYTEETIRQLKAELEPGNNIT